MEDLLTELARRLQGKYYGKYRGFVVKNQDPEKRGRLKLTIPSVLGSEESEWALPCLPFGGAAATGFFMIPEEKAQVWVEFEEGDSRRPIWTGTFWQKQDDVPEDARKDKPTTRLLQTPSGHIIQLDDEDKKEQIRIHHKGGAELLIDEKGNLKFLDESGNGMTFDAEAGKITVADTNNNVITMSSSGTKLEDGNSNSIELGAAGITIKAQKIVLDASQVMLGGAAVTEPVIKGSAFLQLLATHTHTAPPLGGPTSPPLPQGEATTLSTAVMTK